MNRFLNKKKAPEASTPTPNEDAFNALTAPAPTSPGLKKSGTSRWRKNKKPLPEPKPELNIGGALPPSDDFRTSLLMPNLSARFSMLRDQDDPSSLLGKASDDSVLQPRRKSRMTDFGFGNSNGLGDIAEVASINSSVRPPFAYSGRQDSFASEEGYGSENDSSANGSVLNRARPGEGNIMFGGRQKVYMVPVNGANSAKSLGKVVYEDDIGVSPFQKYRRDKESHDGRPSNESQGFDFGLDQAQAGDQETAQTSGMSDSAKDLSHSPSLSSNEKKRSTASTSHSEAPSSTAGTSVASQPPTSSAAPGATSAPPPGPPPAAPPPKRADPKARRLYENGLDQHMQDQQASAMTRLNSIQRPRPPPGTNKPVHPQLHGVRSAGNLNERPPQQALYALRAQSPPATLPLTLNTAGGAGKPRSNVSSPTIGSGPQSPISPTGFELDENSALSRALEPGDRGKATAMGAFNKPNATFDEKQYLERQRMLQRSASNALGKKDAPANPALQQRLGSFEQQRERSDSSASSAKELPLHPAHQQRMGRFEQNRERSESNASAKSRSPSLSRKQETTKAFNVFQRAATQMGSQAAAQQPQKPEKPSLPDTHRTFFGNISASDSEDEDHESSRSDYQPSGQQDYGHGSQQGRWQPSVLPSVSEHPALRNRGSRASKASLAEEDEELEPQPLKPVASSQSLRTEAAKTTPAEQPSDSPTLGPSAKGLNGMMHHLRQQSNQSSVYAQDDATDKDDASLPPEWTPKNLDLIHPPPRNMADPTSRIESAYTSSNPWDLEEIDHAYNGGDVAGPVSPVHKHEPNAAFSSQPPSQATSHEQHSEVSPVETGGAKFPWQTELASGHNRDASTATQQERDAFTSELAARRAAIQENMKSIVEKDQSSRNASPAPSASGAFKAFGMLKQKSSREFVDNRSQAPSSKTGKIFGFGSAQSERSGYSLDINRASEDPGARPPMATGQPSFPPLTEGKSSDEQTRSRGGSVSSRPDTQHSRPARSRAPSVARSRANSEVTAGRSRSRTGPYRDDLEKAMIEGNGSSMGAMPQLAPRDPVPRPSAESLSGRARSASKSSTVQTMVNNIDARNQPAIPQAPRERLAPAGGPSPPALSPNMYSPAASSGRPSPATSPFSQNMTPPIPHQSTMTPPLSGNSTPVVDNFHPPPPPPPSIGRPGGILRKKTISKSDIGEPTLKSATSDIDTIDLPEGASLRNGMEPADAPPPVPPINPRRRVAAKLFGLGRKESDESRDSSPGLRSPPLDVDTSIDHVAARRNRSGSRSPHPGAVLGGQPPSRAESPAFARQYAIASGSVPGQERVAKSPGMPTGFSPPPPHPGPSPAPAQKSQSQSPEIEMDGGMF